ncbi:MAG: hypothetical protein BWX72_00955 [Firmicutes bacterium ADurb.Bin080]|jgi:hypothetical protein|nr:MAG: hypothetical protein BWX72_00955 [Firmicutes bacterium ADurb.Bin080]
MKKIIVVTAVILLVCLASATLLACIPSSEKSAKAKMTNAGYTVTDILTDKDSADRKVAWAFKATKTVLLVTEEIIVVKYVNGSDADEAYETIWDMSSEFDPTNGWQGYNPCQHNSVVYGGTDAALATFEG